MFTKHMLVVGLLASALSAMMFTSYVTIDHNPGSGGSAGTGTAWSNTSNITSEDGSQATVSTSGLTQRLQCTNYGFAIPAGSTIDGVQLRIRGVTESCSGVTIGTGAAHYYQLIVGGSLAGTAKTVTGTLSTHQRSCDPNWPEVAQEAGNYGDTWSATLTPSSVNASNFGVAFWRDYAATGSVTTGIDCITIQVGFTDPNSEPMHQVQSRTVYLRR